MVVKKRESHEKLSFSAAGGIIARVYSGDGTEVEETCKT